MLIASEQVHQIAGPRRVQDAESCGQTEHLRVAGHVSMGDGVEGAALGPFASAQTHQITSPGQHLVRRPPGEREEQDPIRRDSSVEEARHTRGQCPGLARSCSCHDDEGRLAMGRDRQLGLVEPLIPG